MAFNPEQQASPKQIINQTIADLKEANPDALQFNPLRLPFLKRKALRRFKELSNSLSQTNTTLLGVISVSEAGGIRPVVQIDRGDRSAVPDQNPYEGGGQGAQAIDQEKTLEYYFGDSIGLQGKTIHLVMKEEYLEPELEEWLANNGYLEPASKQEAQQEQNKAIDQIQQQAIQEKENEEEEEEQFNKTPGPSPF